MNINFIEELEENFSNIIDIDQYLNIDLDQYLNNIQDEAFELLRELELELDFKGE